MSTDRRTLLQRWSNARHLVRDVDTTHETRLLAKKVMDKLEVLIGLQEAAKRHAEKRRRMH